MFREFEEEQEGITVWLWWKEVTPVLKGKREGAGGELLGPWCGSRSLRVGSDPRPELGTSLFPSWALL